MELFTPDPSTLDEDGGLDTPIGVFPPEQLVCEFHGGRQILKTVKVQSVTEGTEVDKHEFSKDVGFQDDCPDCKERSYAIAEHVNAVLAHDHSTRMRIGFAARDGKDQEKLRALLEKLARGMEDEPPSS